MASFDERALRKAVAEAAQEELKKLKPQMQREMDSLARTKKGRPVAEIERELKRKFPGMNAAGIRDAAKAISEGGEVEFTL